MQTNFNQIRLNLKATRATLRSVSVRPRSTEQAVLRYGAVSTGVAKSKIAKKPAEYPAMPDSRQAGVERVENAWAFAAHPKRVGRRSLKHSVITACSRQARALGVRAGMHYEDAKLVLPELKVFVYAASAPASKAARLPASWQHARFFSASRR